MQLRAVGRSTVAADQKGLEFRRLPAPNAFVDLVLYRVGETLIPHDAASAARLRGLGLPVCGEPPVGIA